MSDEYVLAGDVGGTNLRIAAVARDGTILYRTNVSTPGTVGACEIVAAIVDAAESVIRGATGTARPMGFGLAVAALVNPVEGRILSSPNLPQLNGVCLGATISAKLGLDVVLENDATAAAIGELWLGSSKGAQNSVFVTLGTGIGGGLILDGRPYRGSDGTAGEIGHICVEPEGHPCGCGSRGCVEQYASATAIVRIFRELSGNDGSQTLTGRPVITASAVYDAAVGGDQVARETFRVMGRYLGVALADLIDILNPEMIVIGGGAAGAWDLFIGDVRSEIAGRAFKHPADRARLVRASLGDSAGVLGAARVIYDRLSVPTPT